MLHRPFVVTVIRAMASVYPLPFSRIPHSHVMCARCRNALSEGFKEGQDEALPSRGSPVVWSHLEKKAELKDTWPALAYAFHSLLTTQC